MSKTILATLALLLLTPLVAQAGDPPTANAIPYVPLGAIGDLSAGWAQISDPFARRLPRYATPPSCSASIKGYMYYDTDDNTPYFCDGSAWTAIGTSSTPSFTSVISGYFSTDASNPATTGLLRGSNNTVLVAFRNAANNANVTLTGNSSDEFAFSGSVRATSFIATSGASGTVPVLLYSSNCTKEANCSTQADTSGTGGNFNSSNGTGGTSELIFKSQYTIPADYIVAGRVITVCFALEQTVGASSPNATLRMKLGSTNVYTTTTTILTINNASARISTTCIPIQGTAASGASVNTETGGMIIPILTQQAVQNGTAQPVAIATNAAQTVKISWQWATNPGAGYSVTLRQMWIVGY